MLRVPIWITSTFCARKVSSIRTSINSVTTGRSCRAAASLRSVRPSTPFPWNAYGLVRGLNAPPRIIRAPPAATPSAAAVIWDSVSTEQGPAIICTAAPPSGTPRTSMTVFALCHSRATSLYGLTMCIERSTPGSVSNISGSSLRSSPIAPMSVRSVPREMWTSRPAARIRASTAAISASPASGSITMIICRSFASETHKKSGDPFWAARFVDCYCWIRFTCARGPRKCPDRHKTSTRRRAPACGWRWQESS